MTATRSFCIRLRLLLASRDLRIEAFAEKIGVSCQQVIDWLSGADPGRERLPMMAEVLRADLRDVDPKITTILPPFEYYLLSDNREYILLNDRKGHAIMTFPVPHATGLTDLVCYSPHLLQKLNPIPGNFVDEVHSAEERKAPPKPSEPAPVPKEQKVSKDLKKFPVDRLREEVLEAVSKMTVAELGFAEPILKTLPEAYRALRPEERRFIVNELGTQLKAELSDEEAGGALSRTLAWIVAMAARMTDCDFSVDVDSELLADDAARILRALTEDADDEVPVTDADKPADQAPGVSIQTSVPPTAVGPGEGRGGETDLILSAIRRAVRYLSEDECSALVDVLKDGTTRAASLDHGQYAEAHKAEIKAALPRQLAVLFGLLCREPCGWFEGGAEVKPEELDELADRIKWMTINAATPLARDALLGMRNFVCAPYYAKQEKEYVHKWFLPKNWGEKGQNDSCEAYFGQVLKRLQMTESEDFFDFLWAAAPHGSRQPEDREEVLLNKLGRKCRCGNEAFLKGETGWHIVGVDLSKDLKKEELAKAEVLCPECWADACRPGLAALREVGRYVQSSPEEVIHIGRIMMTILRSVRPSIEVLVHTPYWKDLWASFDRIRCRSDSEPGFGTAFSWFLLMYSLGCFKDLKTAVGRDPVNTALIEQEAEALKIGLTFNDDSMAWLHQLKELAEFDLPKNVGPNAPSWYRESTNKPGELARRLRNVPAEDLLAFLDSYDRKR